jgi:hypothetical protein
MPGTLRRASVARQSSAVSIAAVVAAGYDELKKELPALDALAPILGSWSLPSS